MNSPTTQPRCAARGFTLLELIISVALVLVLMLAVTKIFSITSATIGATQGIAASTRDARAAQAVFARDMAAMASDSPFIWIRYDGYKPAFRNAQDRQDDHDFADTTTANGDADAAGNNAKLTIDLDDNGRDGEAGITGERVGVLSLSNRNHRLDRFSFFARDRFTRQTGNTLNTPTYPRDELVSSVSSSEAWITYGHLALPRPDGSFTLSNPGDNSAKTAPGAGIAQNNSSNYYASQWMLGRVAMLMVLPAGAPAVTGGAILDSNGVAQQYYQRQTTASWTAVGDNLTPLSDKAVPNRLTRANFPASGAPSIVDARYDLVGIDMENAKRILREYIANGTRTWWTDVLASRFEVNPYVIKPINASTSSHQVPQFLPACSQFVVEYAGDFVSQLPDGSLDTNATNGGLSPDGKIDFHYSAVTGERKIQWFGYPRSTSGGNTANAASGDDVLLVGDFVGYITGNGALTLASKKNYTNYAALTALNSDFAAWERFSTSTTPTASAGKKASVVFADSRPYSASILDTFYAAWGPDSIDNPNQPRPKMFRITVAIDRPEMAGRSADPQTFEYVFNVP